MSPGLPRCGSCSGFIEWVIAKDGRRIPLDLGVKAEGSVWMNAETGRAHFLSKDEQRRAREAGQPLRTIHHATCPSVERHRGVSRAQTSLDLFGGDAA